jgi:RNA polymerase sigma factor (sigma-70 family)
MRFGKINPTSLLFLLSPFTIFVHHRCFRYGGRTGEFLIRYQYQAGKGMAIFICGVLFSALLLCFENSERQGICYGCGAGDHCPVVDTYFEDMPSFRGYLYRAVYHNCLKVLRDRNIKELCLTQCGQEEESAGDFGAVIEEEVVRKLRGVIARMPEKRREVMLLCLEEKTVEEIGEILGISVNTVKKHKKEAYQYIRKILSPDIFILFCLLFHPKD